MTFGRGSTLGNGRLRRTLSPAGVLALTLAALSPAGSVYVTGGAVLNLAGTGAAPAMLGGGAATLVGAMLYAELGSAFPHAGGLYHGIGEILGPRSGAAALMLGVITAPALIAFVALGLASYVHVLVPTLPELPVAMGAIALATMLGVVRVRVGMWVTGALLAAEAAALVALAASEWWHPARSLGSVLIHPVVAGPHGTLAATGTVPLILATIAGAYACSGANLALNFAEEIGGDSRAIGRIVIVGSILATVLVAVPIVGVAVGMVDPATTLADGAPIAASVRAVAGPIVAGTFAGVVVLAIFDHVAGAMIAYSRFVFAAARSLGGAGGTPGALATLGDRSGAPVMAVLALAGAAIALTLVGERGLLLLVSGELITPAMMIVAVLVGRRRGRTGRDSFRSPFYPVLPLVGLTILAAFVAADLRDPLARVSILILALGAGAGAAVAPRALAFRAGAGEAVRAGADLLSS